MNLYGDFYLSENILDFQVRCEWKAEGKARWILKGMKSSGCEAVSVLWRVVEAAPKSKRPVRRLASMLDSLGRGERIRTSDPLHPMQVRYQAALRPD